MLTKLNDNLEKNRLLNKGETVVVAVSGGPDSVALLHALHALKEKWDVSLIAAHVNHQLRAEESDKDEEYVCILAETLSIPCEVGYVDVSSYANEHGVGTQVAARELRYSFLKKIAHQYKASVLATAHHLNDQAETILLRLLRGTSPSGLSGIPMLRYEDDIKIIRPFLPSITRVEIEQYIEEQQLHPRLDQSNESRKYARNRVRMDVLPLLRSINPKIDDHLVQLAEMSRLENEFLDKATNEALHQCLTVKKDDRLEVNRSHFKSSDVALQRRMIKLILSHLTFPDEASFLHIEKIRSFICDDYSSSYQMANPIRIFNNYDYTIFTIEEEQLAASFRYAVLLPGVTKVRERNKQLRAVVTKERINDVAGVNVVSIFDYDCFEAENQVWEIRSRLPGDRLKIQGLSGTKKVKDILIDDKVPREARDRYSILSCNDEIMWIPGLRRSDFCKVNAETTTFLYFFWEDIE